VIITLAPVIGLARPAVARERLAVLIAVEDDPVLADNLTEVVISALAERRDRDLVGLRELRGRLPESVGREGGLAACLAEAGCLAELGAAAQADLAVIGTVGRAGGALGLDLALADVRTARRTGRFARAALPDLPALIAALHDGLDQLFPRAPSVRADVAGAPSPSASRLPVPPAPPPPPIVTARDGRAPGRGHASPASYVAFSAGGLAVVSFSAAAIRGSMGDARPVGSTRAQAMADLERRQGYAIEANYLLAAGTVLALAAGAAVLWLWRADRAHPH
jgi:hypothetical protein